jgi:hypothetical protein
MCDHSQRNLFQNDPFEPSNMHKKNNSKYDILGAKWNKFEDYYTYPPTTVFFVEDNCSWR